MAKYLLTILSILALGAFVACELDDKAGGDVIGGDTTGDTTPPAQYKFVRIIDMTTPSCSGNPGPDVDGVTLTKGAKTYALASEIDMEGPVDPTCPCAYKDNPERNDCSAEKGKVVDETDDGCDSNNKFLSLHGGYAWVSFLDAGSMVVLESGNVITVTEITGKSCGGSPETYDVEICTAKDTTTCKKIGTGSELTQFTVAI